MRAWQTFLANCEKDLGKQTVDKWLTSLKVLHFDACNLYLEATDSFQVIWFEEHLRHKVRTELVNNNRKPIKVHLTVGDMVDSQQAAKPKKAAQPEGPPVYRLQADELNPYLQLSSFVFSKSNALIQKLITSLCGFDSKTQTLTQPPQELGAFNPIYIYGGVGSGKSHLLQATASALRQQNLRVVYARAETFTDHVVGSIRAGEMTKFRNLYRNIDVLILDDVQVLGRKGATQEELFHTFNTLHTEGKQIILAANCAPNELRFIEPRLVSRFEWGIVLPLAGLEDKELVAMLACKSQALGFTVPPDVAHFLTKSFGKGAKSLSRALEALMLRTHMDNKPGELNLARAEEYLTGLISEEKRAEPTAAKIIDIVAKFYGLPIDDIMGKSQARECAFPRQISMYLCRSVLKMPFVAIGDLFSRDHSTVMSSCKSVQKKLDGENPEVRGSVSKLEKDIEALSQV